MMTLIYIAQTQKCFRSFNIAKDMCLESIAEINLDKFLELINFYF